MNSEMTTEKMMEYLFKLPSQFEYSLEIPYELEPQYNKDYKNILVTGLGGSAMGGDILRAYASDKAKVPIIVNRDYDIPAFVDTDTLVLVVSYSGNTEETISAYRQAQERQASIVVFTSGGILDKMGRNDGYAVINVPRGYVPRAATGALFAPLALLLEKLGIISGARAELTETVRVLKSMLKRIGAEIDSPNNLARVIAHKLAGTIPIIWGAIGVTEAVALRWKAQINENAKAPAYYNILPELNHNEIVGFEAPAELIRQLSVVILRDKNESERLQRRIEVSKSIIKDKVAQIIEIHSEGDSFLARLYSLVYLGDYVSVYLALEYGINPTPVQVIDYLKSQLAQ